jgi:tetratricopeptide (TPR) repeat protein
MPYTEDTIKSLSVRLLVTVLCCILTWILIGNAIEEKNMLFNMIGGIIFLLVGAFSIGKPLARLLAVASGSLFNPRGPTGGQQPMYSAAKAKRKKGFYEEAYAEYRKIAGQFPEETKPYLEMMDIAVYNLKDFERAEKIYKEALSAFSDEKKKKIIEQAFNEITQE